MNRSRLLKYLLFTIAIASLVAAGYIFINRHIAKNDLDKLGIYFSEQSFVKTACDGNKEAALLFIKAGMDVNARGKNSLTALHCAAEVGDIEVISALLEKNAEVNAKTKDQYSPLITPLHMAVLKGKSDAVKALLDAGADINANTPSGTPLFLAAANGDNDMVKMLIKHGADVHIKDRWGGTALHAQFKKSSSESVVETLLTSGIDVNAKGREGDTPLHLAAMSRDNIGIVVKLIAHGADVNAVSENGTPLLTLLTMPNRSRTFNIVSYGLLDLTRLLLDKGANPNIQNKKKNTPLVAAALGGDIDIVKALLEADAQINVTSREWGTPLHAAVQQGNLAIADLLIKRGADVNAVDCCNGVSVLHTAVRMTNPNTEQIVLLLLEWGALVDARDNGGGTPLMEARNSKLPVVQSLVLKGANVNAKTLGGISVLWWFKNRHSEAVDYLISKGAID